jgi:hypothetical protein
MWENDFGATFETEEDARDSIVEYMGIDDYCEYMGNQMTFEDLFHKVMTLPGFWERVEDEYCAAENDYFNDYYHKVDND